MTEFTHRELSLLVFALEGDPGRSAASSDSPSCEESCPIVEDLDDLFGGGGSLSHEKKLARHLNNHLREALIECGMFELIGARRTAGAEGISAEHHAEVREANRRLETWRCGIELDAQDLALLRASLRKLPRSAWLVMPRTLWRLRKKLKAR